MAVKASDEEQVQRTELGSRIRRLRESRNLGQEAFADIAGIHRNHVGLLERGKIDPRLSTLSRVADALGVTISFLLSDALSDSE